MPLVKGVGVGGGIYLKLYCKFEYLGGSNNEGDQGEFSRIQKNGYTILERQE